MKDIYEICIIELGISIIFYVLSELDVALTSAAQHLNSDVEAWSSSADFISFLFLFFLKSVMRIGISL